MSQSEVTARWVPTVPAAELAKKRKVKVDTEAGELVLVWHEERAYALANSCIHQDRELVRGSILAGRLVCPGHQWAFDLETGYCRERDANQPVHETRVENGMIEVRLDGGGAR